MCFKNYKRKYNEALAEIERLHVEVAEREAALRTEQGIVTALTEEKDQLAADLAEERAKYEQLADNCYIHDNSGRIVHFKPEKRKPLGEVKPELGEVKPKKNKTYKKP